MAVFWFLNPESQLPQAADGTPTVYALLDKNGARLEPDDPRKLAEIGYADGDIVRIIYRTILHQLARANITAKYVNTGEEFSLSYINLFQYTSRSLIKLLIDAGCLPPESQLPQAADGTPTLYCLSGKSGVLLEPFDSHTLAEMGYTNGDTVHIYCRISQWSIMANITAKYVVTGEKISLSNINLHQFTSRDLIEELIGDGVLVPESQLPQAADGTPTVYALLDKMLDKSGVDLDPTDPRNLFELGYVNGDIIRIYPRASRETNKGHMAEITLKNVITGEEIFWGDVDLYQLAGRDLIEQLIGGGVLVPESQLPQAADGTPIVYALLDKNGAKLDPYDPRKLAEIGYSDGDTVRIIQKGGVLVN